MPISLANSFMLTKSGFFIDNPYLMMRSGMAIPKKKEKIIIIISSPSPIKNPRNYYEKHPRENCSGADNLNKSVSSLSFRKPSCPNYRQDLL